MESARRLLRPGLRPPVPAGDEPLMEAQKPRGHADRGHECLSRNTVPTGPTSPVAEVNRNTLVCARCTKPGAVCTKNANPETGAARAAVWRRGSAGFAWLEKHDTRAENEVKSHGNNSQRLLELWFILSG